MALRTVDVLRSVFAIALVACNKERAADETRVMTPREPVAEQKRPLLTRSTSSSLKEKRLLLAPVCEPEVVGDLSPRIPVDSLELRPADYDRKEKPGFVRGTPCKRAKDQSGCIEKYNAMERPVSKREDSADPRYREALDRKLGYLVFMRGDEVGAVGAVDVVSFLAPIENPSEAAVAQAFSLDSAVACDPAQFKPRSDGFVFVTTQYFCSFIERTVTVRRDGTIREAKPVERNDCGMGFRGRPAAGPRLPPRDDASTTAGFFAECTEMEAASVHAFHVLHRDLARLGAPRSLRRRALRSAVDEARHARAMGRLARTLGARPRRAPRPSPTARPAIDVAIENAVVGCVEETWAALIATYQANHATDRSLRVTMASIARDETRHAALAWDVASWLDRLLAGDERAVVARARARAVERLAATLEEDPPAALRPAGLPDGATARELYAACATLWSS